MRKLSKTSFVGVVLVVVFKKNKLLILFLFEFRSILSSCYSFIEKGVFIVWRLEFILIYI